MPTQWTLSTLALLSSDLLDGLLTIIIKYDSDLLYGYMAIIIMFYMDLLDSQ